MSIIYSEITKHELKIVGDNGHHIFVIKNVEGSHNSTYTIDSLQWLLLLQYKWSICMVHDA